jgi:mevalonate kinase
MEFKEEIDAYRAAPDLDALRKRTQDDFFAPARYVLAHLAERTGQAGLAIEWRSRVPVGSGLGSGAASTGSMAAATLAFCDQSFTPQEIAWLAWQGDIVAHGGVASGLDSGASAVGGLVRFTLKHGPQPLPLPAGLPMVVGDTGLRSSTGAVNTDVRHWLEVHPWRIHLFQEIGLLVRAAERCLAEENYAELGHLLNLNHLILARVGVSCDELELLVDAALSAGAYGAKLSGSGRGGIAIAFVPKERQAQVAAAMEIAGGRAMLVTAGAPGVRIESSSLWEGTTERMHERAKTG